MRDERLIGHLCKAEGLNVTLLYQQAITKVQRIARRTKSVAKMDCTCSAVDTTFKTSTKTKGDSGPLPLQSTGMTNGKKRKKTLFREDTSSLESFSDTSEGEVAQP